MNRLLEAILKAVAYYDLFDFPLTAQEIFLALPMMDGPRPALEDVVRALETPEAKSRLGAQAGLFFLRGRERLIDVRKTRYDLAEGKYKKVRRFFLAARFAPFLRAAFVCNTLARSNARAESDIDVYVVAAPGRIWLTRLFVTGLAALLRVRPTSDVTADRICLSFFVSEQAMNLRPLAIEDDVYLAHWLLELYPIYDEAGETRRSFLENSWLREWLPSARIQTASHRRVVRPHGMFMKKAVERLIEKIGGHLIERWARSLQLAWMPDALKRPSASLRTGPPASAGAGFASTAIVLSDDILKFHETDRREEIRERYKRKLEQVLVIPEAQRALRDPEPALV